jgi:UDP-N-acetylmuramate dehydrogenase
MNIQENVSLKAYTTFGIDHIAEFFTISRSVNEVIGALRKAEENHWKVFILGGGSNVLLTKDIQGLVIKLEIKGIALIKEEEDQVLVEVGAGEVWHDFVRFCIKNNWAGVENLSLIPGTVGASPMQNIGAYGVELKEVFHSLTAIHRTEYNSTRFEADDCKFGYRESVFKNECKDKYVITSVTFKLRKTPHYHLEYGAIQEVLQQHGVVQPTLEAVSKAVIEIRESKLPNPKILGNAGSFFKNPTLSNSEFEKLKLHYPQIPGYPTEEGIKVAAGWLIEQAGWKGRRTGQVGVHEKQALVLVNYGGGTGAEIKQLSIDIQNSIFEKFGISLTPEVNFI